MNLIKRLKLKHVDANTSKMLEDISLSCNTWVTMPADKILFNEEVDFDLIWLQGKAILNVVDWQKNHKGHTVGEVWEAFVKCCSSLYTGYTITLRVNQGRNLYDGNAFAT